MRVLFHEFFLVIDGPTSPVHGSCHCSYGEMLTTGKENHIRGYHTSYLGNLLIV